MEKDVQITFRNLGPSEAMQNAIREQAAHLWELSSRAVRHCRILVEAPHRHHQKGVLYHVRVEIDVPRSQGIIVQQDRKDPYAAIREAFASARKLAAERVRRRRAMARHREVKFAYAS